MMDRRSKAWELYLSTPHENPAHADFPDAKSLDDFQMMFKNIIYAG